jgi:hypothetical protein
MPQSQPGCPQVSPYSVHQNSSYQKPKDSGEPFVEIGASSLPIVPAKPSFVSKLRG